MINDLVINVIRKKIKNMYLKFSRATGQVQLSIPLHVNRHTAEDFILAKFPWIEEHKRKNELQQAKNYFYESGEYHPYQGKHYLLNVIHHEKRSKIIIRDHRVIDLYISVQKDRVERKRIFDKWYANKLKLAIPPLLEKWQTQIGETITEWRIKRMKTRWGSCNAKARRIWFNLELAKYSIECLEYVVVHELVHLLEPSHNKRFKSLMNRYLSDWRVRKKELNYSRFDCA